MCVCLCLLCFACLLACLFVCLRVCFWTPPGPAEHVYFSITVYNFFITFLMFVFVVMLPLFAGICGSHVVMICAHMWLWYVLPKLLARAVHALGVGLPLDVYACVGLPHFASSLHGSQEKRTICATP